MPEQMPQQQQENEKVVSPELAETIARLNEAGYLDTSFEGKEVHELVIRPLSKEEALREFSEQVGTIGGYDENIEKDMPYTTPTPESLDVLILNFNKSLDIPNVYLEEMGTLGVRSLTNEEFIQYCLKYASRIKNNEAHIALGSGEYFVNGESRFPILIKSYPEDDTSILTDMPVRIDYHDKGCRFPVVRK